MAHSLILQYPVSIRRALTARLLAWISRLEKAASHSEPAALTRQAERLFEVYGGSILRLAYSYLHNMEDAEDVLQDTLIQYLRFGPLLPGPEQEKAWLLKVAANLSKNRLRSAKRHPADQLEEGLIADHREDLRFIWEAVKQLPEPYRAVIHLYYYEGYAANEIAAILQRRESTIRSYLKRGRARLKAILKEAYDFGEI